jgi:hypothetical protein
MGPGKVVTVLHVMGEWAGQRLARRKPSCPSSQPFRRSAATNAMVDRQSRLLRQPRAYRPVLNLRGEMPPVEIAPRRSRQQHRPHNGEKPNRRRRAAIALVIRLVLRLELRAVMVAPAYLPEGSVLDVLAFGTLHNEIVREAPPIVFRCASYPPPDPPMCCQLLIFI